MSYEQVTIEVANQLRVEDPKKIRLTQHNSDLQLPQKIPIKYNGIDRLAEMILDSNQYTNILYYEILDMQLPTLEKMTCLKVFFHNLKTELQSTHMIRLPREMTIGDLIDQLKQELGVEYADSNIRVMETLNSRVYKVKCHVNSHHMDRSAIRCWTARYNWNHSTRLTGPIEQKLYQKISRTLNQTSICCIVVIAH